MEHNREQVIKALEHWSKNFDGKVTDLVTVCNALALINSQEQKIKKLTEENEAWQKALITEKEESGKAYYDLACKAEELCAENEELKAKMHWLKPDGTIAIKEFAERLKKYYSNLIGNTFSTLVAFHIDEISKEMEAEYEQIN